MALTRNLVAAGINDDDRDGQQGVEFMKGSKDVGGRLRLVDELICLHHRVLTQWNWAWDSTILVNNVRGPEVLIGTRV